MSFCGWLKIFKRKHAVGSEESEERTSAIGKSSSKGATSAGRGKGGGGGSDVTAANGGEQRDATRFSSAKEKASGKSDVDESDLEDDYWATAVAEDDAKADGSDEGELEGILFLGKVDGISYNTN